MRRNCCRGWGKVTHLKPGDKVALEPGKTCGNAALPGGQIQSVQRCYFLCNAPWTDGVFQEYVAHEAGLCFKIPDTMDTMEAALLSRWPWASMRQSRRSPSWADRCCFWRRLHWACIDDGLRGDGRFQGDRCGCYGKAA